jgi:ribosomal protein L24E
VSRRPRWAAVASALALLAAYGATSLTHAQAASSQSMTDPAGDANTLVDGQGHTTPTNNEPRADIVAASASYQPGGIVLSVKTASAVDPRSDAQWGSTDTALSWFIDTTGDKQYDYHILWGVDGGALYSDVMAKADDGTPICTGAGQGATPSLGADGSYVVTVNPACFKNPSAFNWGGRMEFGATGSQIMDRFPDGDNNYWGPVSVGGTTPPPTTPPATRPGGNPVPVPTTATTAPYRPIVAAPVSSNQGFWLLGRDGGVFSFGTAQFYGSIGNIPLNKQIVAMAAKPDGTGYWFVSSDGTIYAFKAPFWGSTANIKLTKPIVGMAPTPSGQGYWLVASDGGIFAFGDAKFYGSTGSIVLNKPIVGMTSSPSGQGYWLVASDGGIFAFGDAKFYGSTGSIVLNKPILGMASSPTGKGYWFVASDGGVFAFGDAPFLGSAADGNIVPVVGMAAAKSGSGYRVARADGSVIPFGSAGAGGGLSGTLSAPMVGIVTAF